MLCMLCYQGKDNLPGQDHNKGKSIHCQEGSQTMFHWLLQLDWRTNWMLVALLLEKVTPLNCRQESDRIIFFIHKIPFVFFFWFDLFHPFHSKISLVIHLTVYHTVLILLHSPLLIFFLILSTCLLAIVSIM